jgi:valyl-tRNA synthetase
MALSVPDRWILSRYARLAAEVNRLMEGYNFGEAGRHLNEFLWGDFADWYVEIAKVQLEQSDDARQGTRAVLYSVLEGSLRLLHPFMPFITEELWQYLTGDGSTTSNYPDAPRTIMLAAFPTVDQTLVDEAAERDWGLAQELIVAIRNARSEYKVEASRWVTATVAAGERTAALRAQAALIARLGRVQADELMIVEQLDAKPAQAASIVIGGVECYLPLAGLIDLDAERARLRKELEAAEADVARREAKLANAGFTERAPANVVAREREGLETAQAALVKLQARLDEL